jgi:serine/threonine protein kinase
MSIDKPEKNTPEEDATRVSSVGKRQGAGSSQKDDTTNFMHVTPNLGTGNILEEDMTRVIPPHQVNSTPPEDDMTRVMQAASHHGHADEDDMTRVMSPTSQNGHADEDDMTRVMSPTSHHDHADEDDMTRVMSPTSHHDHADEDDQTRVSPSSAREDATQPSTGAYGDNGTVVQSPTGQNGHREDSIHLHSSHELLDVDAIRNEGNTVIKDRFVLEDLMGAGGMGSVYKARDLRKVEARDRNPWVAVKLLNEDFKTHPEAFISLQREARKSQTLAHPNIVQVFDFDKEGDTVFMTMELLEGDDLTQLIKLNPTGIEQEEALSLTREMGAALGHAHDHRITHADFKPGNVFLTKEGKAKVLDFGIARAVSHSGLDESEDDKTVFDPGSLGALTPAYASLEMLCGQDPRPSDDIYALGCISYQLLTGKHPYDKTPANVALERGMTAARPTGLSRSKWKALQRAVALRREDRVDSIAEFLDTFAPIAQPLGRRIAGIAAIAIIVGGVGAWQGISSRMDDKERNAEIEAQQEILAKKSIALDAIKTIQTQLNNDFKSLQRRVEQMKNQLEQRLFQFDGSVKWQRQTDGEMAALSQIHTPDDWQKLLQNELVTNEPELLEIRESEVTRRSQTGLNVESWLENFRQKLSDNYLGLSRTQFEEKRFVAAQASIDTARQFSPGSLRLQETSQALEDAIAANRAENAALAIEAAEAEKQRRLAALELAFTVSDTAVRENLETCGNTLDRTGRGGVFSYDITALAGTMAEQSRQFQNLSEQLAQSQRDYIVKLGECIQLYGYSDHVAARETIRSASQLFPAYADTLGALPITPWNNCKASFVGRGERYSCQDRLIGTNSKGPVLVMVPAGPAFDVFAMGKYEVTEAEFNSYCKATGDCAPSGNKPELPVSGKSHTEVEKYLAWLSDETGFHYQLPSLERWYYAASSTDSSLDSNRNCFLDARGIVKGQMMLPADIGASNRWGLVNHVGNARELVTSPEGIQASGGSRLDPMDDCTMATVSDTETEGDELTGFRVMRTVQ